MFKPATLLLFLLLIAGAGWLSISGAWKRYGMRTAAVAPAQHQIASPFIDKMRKKATQARSFTGAHGFNDQICFLVDMSLPSGQNRFFVYDLRKDTFFNAGLVTHGRCNQDWLEGRQYGNTVGCGCTSLGKYKIGSPYTGRFGLAFKLYGLEKTNDNAFARFVVLHSHSCVPSLEVKDDICQSDGCPTVAPLFLQYLSPIITASTKPVMLWIYE